MECDLVKFLSVKALISYLTGVKAEIEKVTWPDKQDVIRLTLIVFVFSGIVGAYLGLLDFTFTSLLNKLVLN